MTKLRRSVPLVALLALAMSLGCSSGTQSRERARFEAFAHRYFMGSFAFSPSWATSQGIHDFDDSLENWTSGTIGAEEQRTRAALDSLGGFDRSKLDPPTQIDYDLARSNMQAHLFELTEMKGWQRDPGQYNYGFMLETMIARRFEPPEARLRSLTNRLRQVGRLLANARANLDNPPRIFTDLAAGDFEGTISYLENDVTQAFASVADSSLKAEFERAKGEAIAATKDHVRWMREKLLPASHGDFVLGEDRYRKKLRYEEMIDLPLDTLLQVGERELARLTARYRAAAAKIDPAAPLDSIVARMRRDHPPADSLLPVARNLIEEARAFCVSSHFIDIPADAHCEVRPTPSFEASRSFASFDGPGPLETVATDAYYNITLPDPHWTRERTEQHLQGFNRWTLPSVSIHEVYPGHYTHFLYMKHAPSFVRKATGSGAFAEGWGLYTEEAVLNHGFRSDDPRVEFGVMRWALTRACRLQVGIRVHARGMTLEQGTQYFMDHAGLERANAEREAGRAAFDPTYSVYTLGALQIRKLRDDLAKIQGKSFDLARFHETILSQGALPVVLLRRMLLHQEGAIL